MIHAHYESGVVTGIFSGPQPDVIDSDGKIAKGTETVELPDDHPDVISFLEKQKELLK